VRAAQFRFSERKRWVSDARSSLFLLAVAMPLHSQFTARRL